MQSKMNILALFDGISCCQMALQRLGIKIDKYYASEIEKNAIKMTQHNFPNTIQLGSVTEWETWKIDFSTIDFIAAGSPCQGFSFAGKQLAFDDPRSKLFFVFVDILRHVQKVNPKVIFLLENVFMKEEHERVISDMLGVNPIKINSYLLSAQSRKRNYWVNFGMQPMGLFGDLHSIIPQPKDKGIMLRDILQPESEVDEKYYLSEKMINWLTRHSIKRGSEFKKLDGNQKASTITTTEAKQNLSNDYITCIAQRGRGQPFNDEDKPTQQTFRIRRLTVKEVCRLQTISDTYFYNNNGKQIVSDSAIYRACGNGWTVDVISYLLKFATTLQK